MSVTVHGVREGIEGVVTVSSLVYSFFPDWESFSDYPKFQSAYKFFMLLFVKFGSANFRSIVHPAIQATSNKAGTASK